MLSDENMFIYYRSGILSAKLFLEADNAYVQEKDVFSSEWKSIEPATGHNLLIPLEDMLKIWQESKQISWEQKKVHLPSGYYFHLIEGSFNNADDHKRFVMLDRKQPIDVVIHHNEIIAFLYHAREDSVILIKEGYESFTPLLLWDDVSKAEHLVQHEGTHYVEMRDGIKLATEVWLPKMASCEIPLPTILLRTPYGRMMHGLNKLRFVQRGFALVSQDVRGREESEGEWIPMIHEIEDGDDTLNWIASQPWSNGKVGMIGGSYGGFVQWAAAASGNPHLKALVSLVTAGSPFGDVPRKGGTIVSGTLAWTFMMAERKMNQKAMERNDWDELLKIRPLKDIPLKALGKEVYFWSEWMKHMDNDEFWKKANWFLHGDRIDVPSLIISGWYDDNGGGTTEAWDMMNRHNRQHQRLILGPWYHSANSTRQIHNVQFGENAIRYDLDVLFQKWFDRFLKDCENGVEKESRVQYYMVGKNQWRSAEQFPPEYVTYKNFYLHSNGDANTSSGDGFLNEKKQVSEPVDKYVFNPEDPAPYLIDMSENECSVPENYREVETREDVLVYETKPLEKDVEIAGDIYAVVYAASSAKDTDWVVRLTDVDEKGNSIRLSDGIIRARYRNTFEKPELLEPGKVEKYEIKMTKIANHFKTGHRIRISITSGAKNLAFPNQNTGNDPAIDSEFVIAEQTIYHSLKYPSCVRLPVIEREGGDFER
ncbi:CocE/NonD family hydrolase [Aneurinibacillus aneurinilyticus]|uniref:CocE/NonD family hydrolase n=1 Tax=Aneurinibacillus aneurinilyticus TaxID=1391 RepID=UPI0023F38B6A|nr:CocE/NonD family hydrolase [Aneurinibacillus aneurinilyticus]